MLDFVLEFCLDSLLLQIHRFQRSLRGDWRDELRVGRRPNNISSLIYVAAIEQSSVKRIFVKGGDFG
jgi:hypothetical protein